METMRLLLLLLTIAAGSARARSPQPPRPLPTLATLELTVPANYPHFIENMQNIFSENYDKVKKIFHDAEGKIRVKLEYKVNHGSIGDRTKVPLRIRNLREHVDGIYAQKTNEKNFNQLQHEFFLLALQMVAEATRFKYISHKIPTKEVDDTKTLKVDAKVMAPENGWDTLSEAETEPSGDSTTKYKLKQSISLNLGSENRLTLSSEKEIKDDVMGLLKQRQQRLSENNDDDSGGVAATASS